jgi:hypothetical protein
VSSFGSFVKVMAVWRWRSAVFAMHKAMAPVAVDAAFHSKGLQNPVQAINTESSVAGMTRKTRELRH